MFDVYLCPSRRGNEAVTQLLLGAETVSALLGHSTLLKKHPINEKERTRFSP
jgi:hypothetical protein